MPGTKFLGVQRGLNTRGGLGVKPGWLLKARNSRYLPGDTESRLWALLGRSRFNAAAIGSDIKAIFPYEPDGGTSVICAHAGDAIYEADQALTGVFVSALSIGGASERGTPFGYLQSLYYPAGPNADSGFWTRQPSGWVKGGHRTPKATATFTATPIGGGTVIASTTDLVLTYRIYDNTTGTESAHGPTLTVPAFAASLALRWFFAAKPVLNGERGTHIRLYRSLLNEPAGKLYRVDAAFGTDGIPLAPPGTETFDDDTPNVDLQIRGLVQSDGEETSLAWAEYGGPPPKARGGIIFNDHAVIWGVTSDADATDAEQASRVYYSAQGLPELYPVDFDGIYQYYLTFSTEKPDVVQLCRRAGPYLLVFNLNSVFRVLSLPTYQDAGFNRKVQDTLTADHGCCSPWGADSFGIGTEESSYCIYVSREHGPMLTNGVSDRPILDQANWLGVVNRAALDQVVVRNYPTMQECWIFYPSLNSSTNDSALIVNYANAAEVGLRVSGPVDVQGDDAFLGWADDGERFYVASSNAGYVYVQDSGTTDEQLNTNTAGDLRLEWGFPMIRLAGNIFGTAEASRVGLEGACGTAITLDVSVRATDGVEEYTEVDTIQLGPGESDDAATAAISGNNHRVEFSFLGPTGSTYNPDSVDCAPCIGGITWEIASIGRQKRMSGS